jgi:hypothetical protein
VISILLHADVLIDRSTLVARLPNAWADVLSSEQGGKPDQWRMAYHNVVGDWASYWDDLDLNQDDSLRQWREGRWRVVRAIFRLAKHEAPPLEMMTCYLDDMQIEIGRRAPAWHPGVKETLLALMASRNTVGIVDPYTPSGLLRGMLDSLEKLKRVRVFGPDELGQVGLDGMLWETLVRIVGGHPYKTRYVSPHPMHKALLIRPPANLSSLPALLAEET